jgi:hypothetical protein
MGRQTTQFAIAALTAVVAAWLATPSGAGEAAYCVTCKNPDQTYLCKVAGEGSRPNDALKLYCVVRTAKEGNHASCSASQDVSGCNGTEKVYSYDGPSIPADLAEDPRVKKLMGRVAHDQRQFDKPRGQGPQTLVELTGRAVSASRSGWRNARQAISGTPAASVQSVEPTGSTSLPSAHSAPPLPATAAGQTPEATPIRHAESKTQRIKHAARDAGSAVGSFARKSYRCMWSLFRNCSGETQAQATE